MFLLDLVPIFLTTIFAEVCRKGALTANLRRRAFITGTYLAIATLLLPFFFAFEVHAGRCGPPLSTQQLAKSDRFQTTILKTMADTLVRRNVNWEYYANNEYREIADPGSLKNLFSQLSALGNGFESLLVDPVLISHRNDFFKFMADNPGIQDPWMARERFIQSTPIIEVYRSLSLTHSELESVLRNGIHSNAIRRDGEALFSATEQPFYFYRHSYLFQHRAEALQEHQLSGTRGSPFISVSEHPEVAISVAQRYLTTDKKVYLFTTKLHRAQLLNNMPGNGTWKDSIMIVANPNDLMEVVSPNGTSKIVENNSSMESFAFGSIDPSAFIWREVDEGSYEINKKVKK